MSSVVEMDRESESVGTGPLQKKKGIPEVTSGLVTASSVLTIALVLGASFQAEIAG